MSRVRIKICGLTRIEDVQLCVRAGADFIGIVLVPASKRAVSVDHAARLLKHVRPFAKSVLLFMDADHAAVEHAVRQLHPDFLQFHGSESADFCDSFQTPYLKAIPFHDPQYALAQTLHYPGAAALLADGHGVGEQGGSGSKIAAATRLPTQYGWFLAGGLDATNVGAAITVHRPFAVDVASGVESAPGIKDPLKVQAFIAEVMKHHAS